MFINNYNNFYKIWNIWVLPRRDFRLTYKYRFQILFRKAFCLFLIIFNASNKNHYEYILYHGITHMYIENPYSFWMNVLCEPILQKAWFRNIFLRRLMAKLNWKERLCYWFLSSAIIFFPLTKNQSKTCNRIGTQ